MTDPKNKLTYLDPFPKFRFLSKRVSQSGIYSLQKVIAGFGHYCMNDPYKVSFTRSFARGFRELKHFVIMRCIEIKMPIACPLLEGK